MPVVVVAGVTISASLRQFEQRMRDEGHRKHMSLKSDTMKVQFV